MAEQRVALVHDWLTGMRGGEKVLELLCELFPEADIHTLIHVPGSTSAAIDRHRVIASLLNRVPWVRRCYRFLLPLMPAIAERMRVSWYDLVIAVSHCVAHGVDASGSRRFIAYYLTPMRYAWEGGGGSYFRRSIDPRNLAMRLARPYLRRWDRRAAGRAGEAVADSRNVRDRVARCYGRPSSIIYPPVDTEYYAPSEVAREDFYLWVGALAPYKRIDLALEAFRRLGRPLVVAGDGQDLRWARRRAPRNIRFLGRQPDAALRDLYRRCRALVFPGEEDFGIVPLEAQACGAPVVAYGRGGALETVIDRGSSAEEPTGVYFDEPTAESLAEAIRRFEAAEGSFRPAALRANALRFSRERCAAAWREYLARESASNGRSGSAATP